MKHTLLLCRPVNRSRFDREVFTDPEDDILALVESGSFTFDNGSGEQTVGALEAVNFKHGIVYRRHITEPAKMYFFRYRSENDIFGSGKVIFRDRERIGSTLRLLHMNDATVLPDDYFCKRTLFADLVNQYRLENSAQNRELEKDPVISDAIGYIKSNLQHKINLNALAAQHYLSYVQFSRRFKDAIGSNPQDYISALRLKRAQELLADTQLPVKQIATTCGFANEYYFSNFFRKHCRMSPTQYRNMIRSTDDT